MKKENGRLNRSALAISEQFVRADIGQATEKDWKGVYKGCMRAIKDRLSVGKRDLGGLERLSRKARKLKKESGENLP